MVFVDTSAWFAYFNPRDSQHTRVRKWMANSDEELLTTDFCVDETLTLLVVRGEHYRALAAGSAFFHSKGEHSAVRDSPGGQAPRLAYAASSSFTN